MADNKQAVMDREIATLREQLMLKRSDFEAMLSSSITVEQFFGLITRAIIANPDLLRCDRLSLIQAALDCANDGLKPDGKEGAFVPFKTKVEEDGKWINILKAQWMPMIRGVIKKILNVERVKSVKAEPVFAKDHFRRWADDDGEHVQFEPARGDRGALESYFAAIWMQDSVVFVEEMTPTDIEKIRNASQAKDNEKGPWVQWTEEMAKKTIIKRLSKRVPLSAEVERVMSRDDQYFLETLRDITPSEEGKARPKGIAARMAALADNRGVGGVDVSAPQGERQPAQTQGRQENKGQASKAAPAQDEIPLDLEGAHQRGMADKAAGKASMAIPKPYRQPGNEKLLDAWQHGYRGEAMNDEEENTGEND